MLRRIILGSWLFGAAGAALAQIDAPQLGWVPDGTHIRPVYGIPASAAVGAAIGTQDLLRIAASASRNYVLVCATDTGVVSVYRPGTGLTPLDGAGIAPDSIVLSPGGSAAALWFNSINQVQIVTGLPEAPSIRQLDASFLVSSMGSSPAALALSDDGAWLAGTWLGETSNSVYAFGPNGEVDRLPIEDRVAALAFFPLAHDIAAASIAGLLRVTGIGSFVQVSSLAAFADSSPPAAGVAVTQDSKVMIAVDRSGLLTAVQIETGAATTIDCGCSPEGLFAMSPSAFRLTGLQGGSFQLFEAAIGEVLFVPLALSQSAEGAAQ